MQLGKGMYIKEQDKDLSRQLLAAVNRSENIELESVIEMICNWNDGKNKIFDFRPSSRKAVHFKDSKKEQWIQQLPRFASSESRDSNDNLSFTPLEVSLLGLIIYVILKAINKRDIGNSLYEWALAYHDANELIGVVYWDE